MINTHTDRTIHIDDASEKLRMTLCVASLALGLTAANGIAELLEIPGQYATIQAAINASNPGDEVHIAAGTYEPSTTIDTLGKAITLRGELNKDGAPTTIIDGQNSIGVLQCINSEGPDTIFENLHITGGDASIGAGMLNVGTSPTLSNCTFTNNSGGYGGGIHNRIDSNPTFENCTFQGNSASNGAGMLNYQSSPVLRNCAFTSNSAVSNGGGMYNSSSSNPTLEDCTFANNSVNAFGGGMYNRTYCSPTIENCTFENNTTKHSGGGIYNAIGGNHSMIGCTFNGNSAKKNGGGISGGGFYNGTLANCTFKNNSADELGGGMYINSTSYATLENCTFTNNLASWDGGGMTILDSVAILTGCTFTECCNIFPANSFSDGGSNEFAGNIFVACDACRADVDCSDEVNGSDLSQLLIAWNTAEPQYDINADGQVDGEDLVQLLVSWGPC